MTRSRNTGTERGREEREVSGTDGHRSQAGAEIRAGAPAGTGSERPPGRCDSVERGAGGPGEGRGRTKEGPGDPGSWITGMNGTGQGVTRNGSAWNTEAFFHSGVTDPLLSLPKLSWGV